MSYRCPQAKVLKEIPNEYTRIEFREATQRDRFQDQFCGGSSLTARDWNRYPGRHRPAGGLSPNLRNHQ